MYVIPSVELFETKKAAQEVAKGMRGWAIRIEKVHGLFDDFLGFAIACGRGQYLYDDGFVR